MTYDIESGLARTIEAGQMFEHIMWVEDYDEWKRSQTDGATEILSRPSYSTEFTLVQRKSGLLRGDVIPNPAVTRPATARNRFTYFFQTLFSDDVYIDQFQPRDTESAPAPGTTQHTYDGVGPIISVSVTVKRKTIFDEGVR